MEREKYVDESWKESAALEKEKLEQMVGKSPSKPAETQKASTSASQQNQAPSSIEEDLEPQEQTPVNTDANFLNHLSSLAYQAMIFMGEIPNPVSGLVEKNLEQSKFLIDTLVILRAKTKGNLSKQESDMLNSALYELQMRFVEISQKEGVV